MAGAGFTAKELLAARQSEQDTDVDAALLEARVDSYLSMMTFGRSEKPQEEAVGLRLRSCREELLDFLVQQRCCPEASSESVADWSRTVAHPSAQSEEGKMRAIVYRWLGTTGLLYCGV